MSTPKAAVPDASEGTKLRPSPSIEAGPCGKLMRVGAMLAALAEVVLRIATRLKSQFNSQTYRDARPPTTSSITPSLRSDGADWCAKKSPSKKIAPLTRFPEPSGRGCPNRERQGGCGPRIRLALSPEQIRKSCFFKPLPTGLSVWVPGAVMVLDVETFESYQPAAARPADVMVSDFALGIAEIARASQ